MILNSLAIECETVDIAAPGMDEAKDYMREKGKKKDGQRFVLPPQIFNGEKYCGVSSKFKIPILGMLGVQRVLGLGSLRFEPVYLYG